jgi:hypothetical protein
MLDYPHANSVLVPVQQFEFYGRKLCLYMHTGRIPSEAYSLYYANEGNPVQHNCTDREVFHIIADEIRKAKEQAELDAWGDNFDRDRFD